MGLEEKSRWCIWFHLGQIIVPLKYDLKVPVFWFLTSFPLLWQRGLCNYMCLSCSLLGFQVPANVKLLLNCIKIATPCAREQGKGAPWVIQYSHRTQEKNCNHRNYNLFLVYPPVIIQTLIHVCYIDVLLKYCTVFGWITIIFWIMAE